MFSSPRVSLGRSRSNSLVLPESLAPAASGRHAEFLYEDGLWWLVDLESTNGTYLNGARVTRAAVASGDQVSLGETAFSVTFVDARPFWRTPAALGGVAALLVALLGGGGYWWWRVRPGDPQLIAEVASRSAYLVALERDGARTRVGTAFAVSVHGVLATNAHVAQVLVSAIEAGRGSVRALAVRSDGFETWPIASIQMHPEWRAGSVAHDVAVLRLSGSPDTVPLKLADPDEVHALRRGAAVSSFGFPAVSTDAMRPRGRLSVDVVSDVRLPFLEVGLGIAPGTSGSPVFGATGSVIGLVVSGDFVKGKPADVPRPSGSNVNWAISVEELHKLLENAGSW